MIKSKTSRFADWLIVLVCVGLICVCLFPLLNILARSLSHVSYIIRGDVGLWPKGFTLDAYYRVFTYKQNQWAMAWTAMLTVACVALSMFMTITCAYPLIYDKLKGRTFINGMVLLTMYFGAGTIPTFILLNDLKMLETPWSLMLPYCLSVFNMIIMRSFLFNIPDSLRESAEIDGAGPVRILISIYLPLSTSVIATLSLFYAVGRWNGYSDALLFIRQNRQYFPLQLLLFNIIQGTIEAEAGSGDERPPGLSQSLRAASIMFATIPILCVYPFLQRYFIAGVTLGAVKG